MTTVAERLRQVRARIEAACAAVDRRPVEVELVAVSKRHPAAAVREAWAAGQCVFGENRVQELVAKAAELAADDDVAPQWHFVGSLQTNKVRDLLGVEGLGLLHSLDRARLCDELEKELAARDHRLAALLQIHATDEPSKHGCPPADAAALLDHVRERCPHLDVQGVMAMGPLEGDPAPVFAAVAGLCEALRRSSGLTLPVLSLGMTDDLEAAVAAGSTMLRIGTAVFGPRD